jgi:hypothetical protein
VQIGEGGTPLQKIDCPFWQEWPEKPGYLRDDDARNNGDNDADAHPSEILFHDSPLLMG